MDEYTFSEDLVELQENFLNIGKETKNIFTDNKNLRYQEIVLKNEINSIKQTNTTNTESQLLSTTIIDDLKKSNNLLNNTKKINEQMVLLTKNNASLNVQLIDANNMMKNLREENDLYKTKVELIQSENNIQINQLEDKLKNQINEQKTKFNNMVYHYEDQLRKLSNENNHLKSKINTMSNQLQNSSRMYNGSTALNVNIQNTCNGGEKYKPVAFVIRDEQQTSSNRDPTDPPPPVTKPPTKHCWGKGIVCHFAQGRRFSYLCPTKVEQFYSKPPE